MKYYTTLLLLTLFTNVYLLGQTIIHSETFDSSLGSWTGVDVTGDDSWFPSAGTAEVNGFGGTDDEDWLISPSLNLDAQDAEYFMFEYNDGFSGSLIELYYSTDYDGSGTAASVGAATWAPIPLSLIDVGAATCLSSQFMPHPAIDISGITGTSVYFAFRYQGLASTSKRYEIDNIRIEAEYYASVQTLVDGGLNCGGLLTDIHTLIRSQSRVVEYTASAPALDVWESMMITDTRRNDANTADIVWDMFTDNVGGADTNLDHCSNRDTDGLCSGCSEGVEFNREHTLPRSWWGGGTTFPSDTQNFDLHHLYPSDYVLNGKKSNFPPGVVTSPTYTGIFNGFRIGSNATYPCTSMTYFEPDDEFKGDYARTFFYMAARYQTQIDDWQTINTRGDCALNGDSYTAYEPWLIAVLLDWHSNDPVSTKELDRNDAVYAIQGNRNPFIDNPLWVDLVWGDATGTPCDEVLAPVELLSFDGKRNGTDVELSWITLSETDNSHFEIEHSTDGIRFEILGEVLGQGTTAELSYYDFIHENPSTGKNYYRLKQIDYSGEYAYSNIIEVLYQKSDKVIIYPTVVENRFTLEAEGSFEKDSRIEVYNLAGQLLIVKELDSLSSLVNIDVAHLSEGQYFVKYVSPYNSTTYKIIKM